MTTTQQAPVENDPVRRALISARDELKALLDSEGCDHAVGVCYCSTRHAIEDVEAALRQPQAARLTEEERAKIARLITDTVKDIVINHDPMFSIADEDHLDDLQSAIGDALSRYFKRLTAAPAQVTREEIALWLWKFSERSSGTLKSTWENFDLSNHWNPSELLREADGLISFLAERGLVKARGGV